MKKVLFLVNHDLVIYNFRKELVERLLQDKFKVYVSSPYGERIDELIDMRCEYIPASINRHGKNIMEDLKLILYYKRIIRKIKPDVVLTYTIKPNIYGGIACKSQRTPHIANITGLGTAVENGGLIQKITTLLYKFSFKKVSCVFFQNTENMQYFIDKKIAINKHRLIPGSGVNLEHFGVLDYPSDDTTEFVFISRIMKQKGIDQYLEAAKHISAIQPKTRFHICGFCEEEYEDKLNEMQNRGIVEYHGMVRDVRDILKTTHCIIHPTYYPEGMSNVLLESAASGRPIITTDRSGCREIVDDGVNGYAIKERDTKDLIEKIEMFINLSYEDKKKMGQAGRKKVENEFDRQIVVNAYRDEIIAIMR